jgi:dolichol kinase
MSERDAGHPTARLDYRGEVWRKLLHLFALVMPLGYFWVPRWTAVIVIGFAFTISLTVDLARIRQWPMQKLWRPMVDRIIRPSELATFTGATHILLSGWLCPLLFSRPAAALGMTMIILGDSAAALVGRRWGRHRYRGHRSWEGSAAFCLACVPASFLIPGVPFTLGLAACMLATVVEALSRKIDDNLTVPLIVGLCTHIALRVR